MRARALYNLLPMAALLAILFAHVAAQSTASTTQVVGSNAVNLPPGDTMISSEHIFWDLSKGNEPKAADCTAIGGMMHGPPGNQRCFISIKVWLNSSPGNVVGEFCVPGQGYAISALLSADDVRSLTQKGSLVWTSAEGTSFGYAQASKCHGK